MTRTGSDTAGTSGTKPSRARTTAPKESREGVELTNPDQELFDTAGVTKRQLLDYLDAVSDHLLAELADRPLSVIRVRPGQPPFMQKNLPTYAPDWITRVTVWAQASHREIAYAVCDSKRTLLWFGNQRAVEYHPTLLRGAEYEVTHLVLDLDPPEGGDQTWTAEAPVVRTAHLVRQALTDTNLAGAIKTSGAKGLHIVVPLAAGVPIEDAAAATRALAARTERLDPTIATTVFVRQDREGKVFVDSTRAGGATVVAAYSPRARPGVPVSFPVSWDQLGTFSPGDFSITHVPELLSTAPSWRNLLPAPQALPQWLVDEGHAIPIARVQAMHEGKRRKARQRKE
jgi:bifunctional non-homologous end joining protein LigD